MKYISGKSIVKYIYDQITGSFTGFLIGMAATSLVSRFFVTRTIKNLWGLTASKAVINKKTFNQLEWIISIVIGFIFFEIMTKIVKKKIDEYFSNHKFRFMRWMIRIKLNKKEKQYTPSVVNQ